MPCGFFKLLLLVGSRSRHSVRGAPTAPGYSLRHPAGFTEPEKEEVSTGVTVSVISISSPG